MVGLQQIYSSLPDKLPQSRPKQRGFINMSDAPQSYQLREN